MRRSEIFAAQMFAFGKGVKLDSHAAEYYVLARTIRANPDAYTKEECKAADEVVLVYDEALAHGKEPITLSIFKLPWYDDGDTRGEIFEDVDQSILTLEQRRLLASPYILLEDCTPEFQQAYREMHK